MIHWFNCKTYWSAIGKMTKEEMAAGIKPPPPPTKKTLDYVTLYVGTPTEMQLCIGVWDDYLYSELNREELAWHRSHGG